MKYFLSILSTLFILITHNLAAADGIKFEEASFDSQLKAGKSILVTVHAPWCSTCRAQVPVLKDVLSQKEFQKIVVMNIDFDSEKEVLKKLNVQKQSTLIAFKSGIEVGRSIGDTTNYGIKTLLQKAI